MTILGKTIITAGIGILTAGTIIWILTGNWQWIAGGASIFFGSLLTGGILSAETKPNSASTRYTRSEPDPHYDPYSDRSNNPHTDGDGWTPPPGPPPDHHNTARSDDPFSS